MLPGGAGRGDAQVGLGLGESETRKESDGGLLVARRTTDLLGMT
jgi:hypothetical protein